MLRFVFRYLSPEGQNAQLPIFIFHRVRHRYDPLLPTEPSAEQFEWIVKFLARSFNVLPLGEAIFRLKSGTLPSGSASITFDDGYADNLEVAWPILKHAGVTATFFIASSFLDGGCMWNDNVIEATRRLPEGRWDLCKFDLGCHTIGNDSFSRVTAYEAVLGRLKYFEHGRRTEIAREIASNAGVPKQGNIMLTNDQLCSLRALGAEIGGHTRTHPILELLDDNDAAAEIEYGKRDLESLLNEQVGLFAYPNGAPGRDYSSRHAEMVSRAGFFAAVTTEPAFANARSELFQLPRFTPWDRTPSRFATRCALKLWSCR